MKKKKETKSYCYHNNSSIYFSNYGEGFKLRFQSNDDMYSVLWIGS